MIVGVPGRGILAIEAQDVRQHECHRVAVHHLEARGERIGGSMSRAQHAVLDRQSREGRPQEHFAAIFQRGGPGQDRLDRRCNPQEGLA